MSPAREAAVVGGARLGEVGPCQVHEHTALGAAAGGGGGAATRHEAGIEGADRRVVEELVPATIDAGAVTILARGCNPM